MVKKNKKTTLIARHLMTNLPLSLHLSSSALLSTCLPFLYPCHQHTSPPSLSCLDPSLFHVPGENGVRLPVYFFTMSEPQAAHATSTRPLMPPDQEQVVNIIPLEGFSNVGCTLCEEAQSGEK